MSKPENSIVVCHVHPSLNLSGYGKNNFKTIKIKIGGKQIFHSAETAQNFSWAEELIKFNCFRLFPSLSGGLFSLHIILLCNPALRNVVHSFGPYILSCMQKSLCLPQAGRYLYVLDYTEVYTFRGVGYFNVRADRVAQEHRSDHFFFHSLNLWCLKKLQSPEKKMKSLLSAPQSNYMYALSLFFWCCFFLTFNPNYFGRKAQVLCCDFHLKAQAPNNCSPHLVIKSATSAGGYKCLKILLACISPLLCYR